MEKKRISNIPCLDCLVFPSCLAKTAKRFMLADYLQNTCSIFKEYMNTVPEGKRYGMLAVYGHFDQHLGKRIR